MVPGVKTWVRDEFTDCGMKLRFMELIMYHCFKNFLMSPYLGAARYKWYFTFISQDKFSPIAKTTVRYREVKLCFRVSKMQIEFSTLLKSQVFGTDEIHVRIPNLKIYGGFSPSIKSKTFNISFLGLSDFVQGSSRCDSWLQVRVWQELDPQSKALPGRRIGLQVPGNFTRENITVSEHRTTKMKKIRRYCIYITCEAVRWPHCLACRQLQKHWTEWQRSRSAERLQGQIKYLKKITNILVWISMETNSR
jgi:hypothetical protein